jgi:hypothetical protein
MDCEMPFEEETEHVGLDGDIDLEDDLEDKYTITL